jgi:hypothetical protein
MIAAAEQRLIALVGAPEWTAARRAADAYREVLRGHGDLFQMNDPSGRKHGIGLSSRSSAVTAKR